MVHGRAEKMSASGGRVLGAAVKEEKDLSEKGMTFLGMAVLEDPVRPEVSEQWKNSAMQVLRQS